MKTQNLLKLLLPPRVCLDEILEICMGFLSYPQWGHQNESGKAMQSGCLTTRALLPHRTHEKLLKGHHLAEKWDGLGHPP